MGDVILSLAGIAKSFGGLKVVDDLSFDVPRGSRTALIGPNGAGKTTVFNLISGVYAPDSGTIRMDGVDITALPARLRIRHGIARSFQNVRLMPHLSTVENVMLGEQWRSSPLALTGSRRSRRAAEDALATAGLGTFPNQVVSTLPYGIQKRIEVVRALAAQPRLLMLDEPAAGLNSAETAELRTLLERATAQGITLLVVEHDMNFVRRLCDHVVVLNFGRKVFDGTVAGAHAAPAVREAYLGTVAA
jgi:branched-chain amino acid transport system ATP-binding protein